MSGTNQTLNMCCFLTAPLPSHSNNVNIFHSLQLKNECNQIQYKTQTTCYCQDVSISSSLLLKNTSYPQVSQVASEQQQITVSLQYVNTVGCADYQELQFTANQKYVIV